MSAKSTILKRIRQALGDVRESSPEKDVHIDWTYGQPTAMDDVVERFVEQVSDYGATMVTCSAADVPAEILKGFEALGVESVVVPTGVDKSWAKALTDGGIEVRWDDPPLSAKELDLTGGVLTAAACGVAETGTIVLDHAPDQGRRALTLVPDNHVCVVRRDQVVSDVPEMVAQTAPAIRNGSPCTWISGGSATSDIELSRVEGVHGPRNLYVIVSE